MRNSAWLFGLLGGCVIAVLVGWGDNKSDQGENLLKVYSDRNAQVSAILDEMRTGFNRHGLAQ